MSSSKRLMTFELLEQMAITISKATTIPIFNRILLDKEEFSSLMRRLEESIPADLQKARTIIEQEEQILNESNKIASETTQKASSEAQATIADAKTQASAMVNDAQARANETMRSATDQANAMVNDAQARANAMIADAQAQAQQMVADSEITARAQAEAQEMLENTHRECDDFTARMHDAVGQMMEQADIGLSQQLDALRAMRQQFTNNL